MSDSTASPGMEGSTSAPNSVLGLPVDTFAYILVGVGIGGAIVFVVIYCLAKAYCKCCCCGDQYANSPKRRSNAKSVREAWELDTLKRKRDLEAAGYANDAFDNLEELSALSFHQSEKDSSRSVSYTASPSQSNGIVHSNKNGLQQPVSSDHMYKKKKKQNGAAVRQSKSSPPNLPLLQVNGESLSPDFEQSPRSKLGSSLVRIEEEVIVEEELDVEKSKFKKKSKSSKKSLLTPEQSSDGYRAEEAADITVVDAKAVTPTGSLLNSVVVVHADNDMFKDGETGEQVALAGVDAAQVSLDMAETPLLEQVTDDPLNPPNEIHPGQSVSVDSIPSDVKGVVRNNHSELQTDFAHDNLAFECDEETPEQKDITLTGNGISHQNDVIQVSKDSQTDLKNLTNETIQTDNNNTESTSVFHETTNDVSVSHQSNTEFLNLASTEANIMSQPSDSSVMSDRNIDTVSELETGEEVLVGGIHHSLLDMTRIIEGQSSEKNSKIEASSQDAYSIHNENVSPRSVLIQPDKNSLDRELGDHNSRTDSSQGKPSNELETEANFINNNSVHYSSGKQSSLVYKRPNGLANGSVKGLILTDTSHTLVPENGLMKQSDISEEDKLRSWLHDVYVSRGDEPSHL